jgi:hypothetical protein
MEPEGSLPQLPATCPNPETDQSQSMPPPLLHVASWRSILILSSHLCLRPPSVFHRKIYIHVFPDLTVPPLSQVTSCTSNKSNLYLANALATAVRDPDLYRLLTFQVPNLTSLFHCLGYTKGPVQARGARTRFKTRPVFRVRSSRHLAQPPSWRTTPCRVSATAYSIY